jgi:hypothetical protein
MPDTIEPVIQHAIEALNNVPAVGEVFGQRASASHILEFVAAARVDPDNPRRMLETAGRTVPARRPAPAPLPPNARSPKTTTV